MNLPKFEIVEAKGDRHKLTISPSQQRVTIKLAKDADDAECWRVEQFFRGIYVLIGFTQPSTLRGNMKVGRAQVELWNDSRSQSMKFGIDSYGDVVIKEKVSHE